METKIEALHKNSYNNNTKTSKRFQDQKYKRNQETRYEDRPYRPYKQQKDENNAWLVKHVEPDNPNQMKSLRNKTFHWCGKSTGGTCEKWHIHKEIECFGTQGPNSTTQTNNQKKKVKFMAKQMEFDTSDKEDDTTDE